MRVLVVSNAYPTPRHPDSGTFIERQVEGLRRSGVNVQVLFANRLESGMSAYLKLKQRLLAQEACFKPDLVHVMYGGVLAAVVVQARPRLPVVVSFCGSDLFGEPDASLLRSFVARAGVVASHVAARQASTIIVKSKNLEALLPGRIDRDKIHVLPNGVDLELFRLIDRDECRRRLNWERDIFHVLFAAQNPAPVKRPYLAQAAVRSLAEKGIEARLHFMAGVNHADVPVWLNASDALLLTSQHEGSANIVKEALACSIPVVSVRVGDVFEQIGGVEGCHLAEPNAEDLAHRLWLVSHGSRRISCSSSLDRISLQATTTQLIAIYKHTLGDSDVDPRNTRWR